MDRRKQYDQKQKALGLYRTSVWIPQTKEAREALSNACKRIIKKYGNQEQNSTANKDANKNK